MRIKYLLLKKPWYKEFNQEVIIIFSCDWNLTKIYVG